MPPRTKQAFIRDAPDVTVDDVAKVCSPGILQPRIATTGKGSAGWKCVQNVMLKGFKVNCSFHVNVDGSLRWSEAEKNKFLQTAEELRLAVLGDRVSFKKREPEEDKTAGWHGFGCWNQGGDTVRASFNINVLDSRDWPLAEEAARERNRSWGTAAEEPEELRWAELVEAAGGHLALEPQIAKSGQHTVGWRLHQAKGLQVRGYPVSAFLDVNVLKSGSWTEAEKETWVRRMPALEEQTLGEKFPTLKRDGEGWSARHPGWNLEVARETVRVNAQFRVVFK